MNSRIAFEGGFTGEVTGFSDGVLSAIASRAYAPGAPMRFDAHLVLSGGDVGPLVLHLSGRSLGSKRRDDGQFLVRIRLTNLRRAEREALERF